MQVRTDNPLMNNLHDYCMADAPVISLGDPDLPHPPVTPSTTPSKPPAPKKMKSQRSLDLDSEGIVQKISAIFNMRMDSLEKSVERMISNNTLKIEGLKKTVDFACAEIRGVKDKLTHIDDRVKVAEKKASQMEQRITELENYSRRWNLRLYGVAENKEQNVRQEVIHICQTILPEHKAKLPDVIDSVHRLGQPKKDATKPRGIILQFGARIYRDAVWKAAKKSSFLQNNKLRFAEDLSPAIRERRMQLWLLVAKAREQGNAAYFLGGRAFANGAELFPDT
ncbi:hypothetical protein DPEC_G00178940 [Dallia pectoralis]|uniref:Uncharacterized protein n=1 Tax=Dallia pectoralis TaxID=75939 RepID=A0ACC2GFU9_DALPE|nr:hypothetical protein DPEC_G00178940 [Dallia pectoralis]